MDNDSANTRRSVYMFGGQAIAQRTTTNSSNTLIYLHCDHLGSVSVASDGSSGALVSSQEFDPWGATRSGGISQTKLNYTGQRRDDTGLLYYGARYYNPTLARFISADTVVPGMAMGAGGALGTLGMDKNTSHKGLTVDYHEPGINSAVAAENQFTYQHGFWFQLSDKQRQQSKTPWGPLNPQALNRYSYVLGNPLRYTDPTGHCPICLIILVGALAGLGTYNIVCSPTCNLGEAALWTVGGAVAAVMAAVGAAIVAEGGIATLAVEAGSTVSKVSIDFLISSGNRIHHILADAGHNWDDFLKSIAGTTIAQVGEQKAYELILPYLSQAIAQAMAAGPSAMEYVTEGVYRYTSIVNGFAITVTLRLTGPGQYAIVDAWANKLGGALKMPKTKKEICQLFKANELRTQRRFEEALDIYTQLAQGGYESAELLAVIGECYFEFASVASNGDECNLIAIQWMQKAVAMAPDDSSLHARLALLYWLAVLDYEHSVNEFRIAIELNPNNPHTLLNAAGIYGVPGGYVSLEEALRWLEMAIRIDPDNPQYYLRLGDVYNSAGQTQKAEQAWTKALLCTKAVDVMLTRGIEWRLCRE